MGEPFKGNKPLFEVTKWYSVASWSFEGSSSCAICRNELVEPCIECQNQSGTGSKKFTTADLLSTDSTCPLVVGHCSHRFHKHCLDRWLKDHKSCHIDSKPWMPA